MKNHATLRKSGKLIADITGTHEIVREFIYENLKLYDLVPAVDDREDWDEGFSDRWVNGDIELSFKLEEV